MGAPVIEGPCWLYFTRDADGFARDVNVEAVRRALKLGEFERDSASGNYDKNLLHTLEAQKRLEARKALERPVTMADLDVLRKELMEAINGRSN